MARAITLIESRRADQAAMGQSILEELVPETGKAMRIGITGPPGVGKSTLIEALGGELTGAGHRVAVTAVDPSSRTLTTRRRVAVSSTAKMESPLGANKMALVGRSCTR